MKNFGMKNRRKELFKYGSVSEVAQVIGEKSCSG